MKKRMLQRSAAFAIGVVCVICAYLQYRSLAYVPKTSVRYSQILDLLETSFGNLNFHIEKGDYKKQGSLPSYNQSVRCSAFIDDREIKFTITLAPVSGAPVPFSGVKGWNIETDLPENYLCVIYQETLNKTGSQRIDAIDLPGDGILLYESGQQSVFYSQDTGLFYECRDGRLAAVASVDTKDLKSLQNIISRLHEHWYIPKK